MAAAAAGGGTKPEDLVVSHAKLAAGNDEKVAGVLKAKVPEGSMLRVTLDDDKAIVRLGSLWNEETTRWESGNLFNKDLVRGKLDHPTTDPVTQVEGSPGAAVPSTAVQLSPTVHTEITSAPSDNVFSDYVTHAKDVSKMFTFDASLSMAFMGGMLKISGHGHYDSSDIDNYSKTSFVYAWRRTTATERVKQSFLRDPRNFWDKYQKDRDDASLTEEDKQHMPTHFVSAIVYGGTLSMTSTAEKSFHGHEQTIGGGLEVSYAALASGKADFTMGSKEAEYYEGVTTTIKGDVNIPSDLEPGGGKASESSGGGGGGGGDSSISSRGTSAAKAGDEAKKIAAEMATEITSLQSDITKLRKAELELKGELDGAGKVRDTSANVVELTEQLENYQAKQQAVRNKHVEDLYDAYMKPAGDEGAATAAASSATPTSATAHAAILKALEEEIQLVSDKIEQLGQAGHNKEAIRESKEAELKEVTKAKVAKEAQLENLEKARDRLIAERGNRALNSLRNADMEDSSAAFQGKLRESKDAAASQFDQSSWAKRAAGLKGAKAAIDAYAFMAKAPELLASAIKKHNDSSKGGGADADQGGGFYGVPLYYVLQPISSVVDSYAKAATKMREDVAKATTDEYARFESDMARLGWLSRHRALMMSATQKDEIKSFHHNFHTYMLAKFKNLGKLLPALRAGVDGADGDGPGTVMGILKEMREHPHFSSLEVSRFYDHHRRIVATFDGWLCEGALAVRRVKPIVATYLAKNVAGGLDGGGSGSGKVADGSDTSDGKADDDALTDAERNEPLLEQAEFDRHKSFLPYRPFFETTVLTRVGPAAYNARVVVARDVHELQRALDNPLVSHDGRSVLLHSIVRPAFAFKGDADGDGESWPDGTRRPRPAMTGAGAAAGGDAATGKAAEVAASTPPDPKDANSGLDFPLATLPTSLFAQANKDGGARTPFIIVCDITDRTAGAQRALVGGIARDKSSLTLLDPRRATGELVYGNDFRPPSAPSNIRALLAVDPGADVPQNSDTQVKIAIDLPEKGSRLGSALHVQFIANTPDSTGMDAVHNEYVDVVPADSAGPVSFAGTLKRLLPNTRYFVRARATVRGPDPADGLVARFPNVAGHGPWSSEMDGESDYKQWLGVHTVPSPPSRLKLVTPSADEAGSHTLRLSLNVPPQVGPGLEYARLIKIQIRHTRDRAAESTQVINWDFDTAVADAGGFVMRELTPNSHYNIQVRVVSGLGPGPWSEAVSAYTLPPMQQPLKLLDPVAGSTDSAPWVTAVKVQLVLSAQVTGADAGGAARSAGVGDGDGGDGDGDGSDGDGDGGDGDGGGGEVPMSYDLRWSEADQDSDSWTLVTEIKLSRRKRASPDRPRVIEDLKPNSKYKVQVRAVNHGGAGKWSNPLSACTLPRAPISVTVKDAGAHIVVMWPPADAGNLGIATYAIKFTVQEAGGGDGAAGAGAPTLVVPGTTENVVHADNAAELGWVSHKHDMKGKLKGSSIAATVTTISMKGDDWRSAARSTSTATLYQAAGASDSELRMLQNRVTALEGSEYHEFKFGAASQPGKYVLKSESVGSSHLAPGAVDSVHIRPAAVKHDNVARGVIKQNNLASQSVTSVHFGPILRRQLDVLQLGERDGDGKLYHGDFREFGDGIVRPTFYVYNAGSSPPNLGKWDTFRPPEDACGDFVFVESHTDYTTYECKGHSPEDYFAPV